MTETVLGIIGGSGVYEIDGLEDAVWRKVDSPWGEPSDEFLFGKLNDVQLVFLPRHGRGHIQSPSTINYRANIDALKRSGVTDIISVSACGSFKEDLSPGTFVLVDQFIDRTHSREKSFFGPGMSAAAGRIGRGCVGGRDYPSRRWHLSNDRGPAVFKLCRV